MSKILTRRRFIARGTLLAAAAGWASSPAGCGKSSGFPHEQNGVVIPLVEGPEVERYRRAQKIMLDKYGVGASSRFVRLRKPVLNVHVLEAGRGEPVVFIHGGGAMAVLCSAVQGAPRGRYQIFGSAGKIAAKASQNAGKTRHLRMFAPLPLNRMKSARMG